MPTRRKARRRKRSPIFLVLLLVGGLCCVAAAARWLWSPDTGPARAATARVPSHAPSAPPDIAVQAQRELPTAEPIAAQAPSAAATRRPAEGAVAEAMLGAAAEATPPDAAAQLPASLDESAPHAATSPAAATPSAASNGPKLAIIIDDCGQWPVTEHGFVDLPFPVTLSVLPHVRYGSAIARAADAAGKGVMLHLPMQTLSGRYPGPGTITVAMGDDAIRAEVAGDLAELPQARGVNNHEGSRATMDHRVMNDIADVLAHDGRFFIDSRTSSGSVAERVTRERGVPSAGRNVFLDNVDDVGAIEAQLLEAARDARATGSAIAIGHPRPATLAAVRNLGPKLVAAGIEFTLASTLVH